MTASGKDPTTPPAKTAAKKRGLGRGLEALLGPKAAEGAPALEARPGDSLRTLPVDALAPGKYQPRRQMDPAKLAELSESIRAQGVIQPIVVRQLPDRTYEIIAGERRWRASRQAGLTEVPVVVREVDDRTVVAMALIENIQREDLNPLEEAQALQRLIDEFDLTHAQAAENGWSVREVEHRAQQFAAGRVPNGGRKKATGTGKARPPADIMALENELSEVLAAKVSIAHGRGNKGRLVIHYTDLDTLEGVLERLRGQR